MTGINNPRKKQKTVSSGNIEEREIHVQQREQKVEEKERRLLLVLQQREVEERQRIEINELQRKTIELLEKNVNRNEEEMRGLKEEINRLQGV